MSPATFYEAVRQMRIDQKRYFKNKTKASLFIAFASEKTVDQMLAEIEANDQ